jgi:hypothetical protein
VLLAATATAAAAVRVARMSVACGGQRFWRAYFMLKYAFGADGQDAEEQGHLRALGYAQGELGCCWLCRLFTTFKFVYTHQ